MAIIHEEVASDRDITYPCDSLIATFIVRTRSIPPPNSHGERRKLSTGETLANCAHFGSGFRTLGGLLARRWICRVSVFLGVSGGGSTSAFFEQTKISPYANVSDRLTYVKSIADGIKKTRNGSYVFVSGNPTLKYYAGQRPCDLQVKGRSFAHASYSFGFPKNSRIKDAFSLGISKLSDEGVIEDMEKKWFLDTSHCRDGILQRLLGSKSRTDQIVAYSQVESVFVIIYCGLVLAMLLVVVEWIAVCIRDTRKTHTTTFSRAFRLRWTTLTRHLKRDYLPCRRPYLRKDEATTQQQQQ